MEPLVIRVLWYLLIIGACMLFGVYWYFTCTFGYWKKKGVPHLKPEPFFGNMKELTLLRTSLPELFQKIYHQFESHRYAGVYQSRVPSLMIRDPELIKSILVKDFQHFPHRGLKVDENRDPLSANLFNLGGYKWRMLRTKISPTFTSGKMKMMFQLIEECAQQLREYLAEPAEKEREVEMKEILAKFTTEVIGTCAFGLQFNAIEDPHSEFRRMGRAVFKPTLMSNVRRFTLAFIPELAKIFNISFITKDVTDFFLKAVKETVTYREENNIRRNDFLQLLIDLKNKGHLDGDNELDKSKETSEVSKESEDKFELSDNLLAAQVFLFFLAGFETSSTTMSFCLHELAVNPDIQTKLQEEIDSFSAESGGKITYDGIHKMQYLDKVVSETLRKYPPVPILVRECTEPYRIPDSDLTVEKGNRILIPVYAIHHDPKIYPEPKRFDPDRFTEEKISQRHHYSYLPFGEGPRICTGMRFGILQTKIGLVSLLSMYEFSVCSKTVIPVRIDPKTIVTSPIDGNWLKIRRRN
ncbi:probable cytochrome P450 6a14 [Anabrus simplex]|uniref:probable cytochrome P450 6a14 n=1 Tax=Anabrus simplex TaxID=316456 RepID=UPI0035A3A4B5